MWLNALRAPTAKTRRTNTPPGTSPDQWDNLRVPGKNGVYLILISLVWWGTGLSSQGASPLTCAEWTGVVHDVSNALKFWGGNMNDEVAISTKRKRGVEDQASKRARR